MIFGHKDAVSRKNNWFGGNSLFPARKRRTRNLPKKIEVSTPNVEESNKYQSIRPFWSNFSSNLFQFNRKPTRISQSIPEDKRRPVVYHQKKSNHSTDMSNTGISPLWLLKLQGINRYSSVSTFVLVLSTLTVYSLTVYSQELWSDNYKKLQSLQRHERQLNTANATLTSKMGELEGTRKTGVTKTSAESPIFINPTPENALTSSESSPINATVETESPTPLGY